MLQRLRDPSFLPSCILAGVGFIFLVLIAVLPPGHVFALVGGTGLVVGLALARLRRDAATSQLAARIRAKI